MTILSFLSPIDRKELGKVSMLANQCTTAILSSYKSIVSTGESVRCMKSTDLYLNVTLDRGEVNSARKYANRLSLNSATKAVPPFDKYFVHAQFLSPFKGGLT